MLKHKTAPVTAKIAYFFDIVDAVGAAAAGVGAAGVVGDVSRTCISTTGDSPRESDIAARGGKSTRT